MNIKKLLLTLALVLLPTVAFGQQNTLTQTTLSSAVPATTGSLFTSSASSVVLAACTNITGVQLNPTTTLNTQNQWVIYVDREAMLVYSVSSSGCVLQVQRGYNGTVATSHASGAMVLFGRQAWFYVTDPGASPGVGSPAGVTCTAASVYVSPYLNIRTGAQWLCSTITGTWVPGFNNSLYPSQAAPTVAVASVAGATLPSGPLFHVTGTNAITSWTIPVGCNATAVGGCAFTIIPDAVCTWTAAGNIALAGSCVVNKALTFVWDAKNSKWIPSYIA